MGAAASGQDVLRVEHIARDAAGDPDAWNGLLSFIEGALELQHGNRGRNDIMHNPLLGDERVNQVRDRIVPPHTELVENAKPQGVVRTDLDQTDLVFIQPGLSAIMNRTTTIAPELCRGYLTIVLDGIRTERTGFTPLPTRALTASETHEAMTTVRARQDGYPPPAATPRPPDGPGAARR